LKSREVAMNLLKNLRNIFEKSIEWICANYGFSLPKSNCHS